MGKILGRKDKPAGSSPGTVVYIGEVKDIPVTVSRMFYCPERVEEQTEVLNGPSCVLPGADSGVVWFNVDGVHDECHLKALGESFKLHPLVVEDVVNTTQRPKSEDFEKYIFVTLKMITYDAKQREIVPEHVSLILGHNYVVSFLENPGDVFDPVRARIRSGKGRIRKLGADYLMYALLDAVVDHYFEVLEQIGDDIEGVEEEVVERPTKDTLRSIHRLKRELVYLRRAVWPLREAIGSLVRDECDLIKRDTDVFLRDLYDHTVQAIDTVETSRDIVSGMLEVYLSSLSNRMNEVMKVLTVMSSIFIPLTFIVGIYGMNFEDMPELKLGWGYPAVLLFMAGVAATLLGLFRRRGWI